ncbi:hypothetical protein H257_03547 [Aphanomyces astaci]|uniref:Uncharacterized protein n=1 Tax=Aphanomyces astaci TaxID=112090 RepID=W4GX91_APHAT|nr:hypothetical protein H257_03547 [Aphanomyces astaci]ETV84297.1 hypothetical protein H257_03547 [Aphanomyces astaci]|eukprot:XP_009825989.1 hypothetical protein H257_03547 [Aphanomyces astaci]
MRLEDGSTHHLVYGKVHDQLGRHVPHVVVEIHAMMDDNGGPRGVQVSTDSEGWFQQLLPRDATSIRLLVEEQSNECHLHTSRNEGASAWDCSVRIHVKSTKRRIVFLCITVSQPCLYSSLCVEYVDFTTNPPRLDPLLHLHASTS